MPVRPEHGTISTSPMSSRAASAASAGSATSAFVIATTPSVTPSAARTAACSIVWGMTPSSAAITIR